MQGKERLRITFSSTVIVGETAKTTKLDLVFDTNSRIECNFQNQRMCKITAIRAYIQRFIEKVGPEVSISVKGQFLDENEVVNFSELLKDNSLVSLSLNNTGINGKGACALFEKLANNTQLRTLSLDSNDIDNAAIKSLSLALASNRHITTISLADNPQLTSLCVRNLGEAITAHPSLKLIRIDSLTEFDQLFLQQKIIQDQRVKKGSSGDTPPRSFSILKWLSKAPESKPEDVAMVSMQSK